MPDKIVLELTVEERSVLNDTIELIEKHTNVHSCRCQLPNFHFDWSDLVLLHRINDKIQATYRKPLTN